jgi:PknH-like extracellular domain
LFRHALAVLVAGLAVAGCSSGATATHPSTPEPVPASKLDGLLPGIAEVNAVMGTPMTPHQAFSTTTDHRNLLPNLNCLGIWQIGETTIYGPSGFTGMRGQVLREPDNENWDSLVVQAVVSYPSADAAKKFFAGSADRWQNCSNHRVNMTVNGRALMTLAFGGLTKTDTELTIPLNTSGGGVRSCQRVLAVDNNVIIDVSACGQTIGNQATSIASKIQARTSAVV